MLNKTFLQVGALMALLGVVLGAFGAHSLKALLPVDRLATFEIGVRYQMYHAIAIVLVALLTPYLPKRSIKGAGWLFLAGIILFSGSLYLLACRDVIGLTTWRWLGPLTPIGGVCFIAGWAWLFIAANKLDVKISK